MSIPGNLLTDDRPESPLLTPDNLERVDPRRDWERGGVALSDPTQGLNVRNWTAWTDGIAIFVAPYPEQTPAVQVQTGVDITEVSLAFDQNMQPNVVYVDDGLCKLWWYDSTIPGMTTTSFPGYRTPMLTLDDKRDRATNNGQNDIIFAYVRDGLLCWRQQRDRYTIERVLGALPNAATRIVGMGMAENNRLQIRLKVPPTSIHADRITDTLYVLTGEDIVGVERGPVASGTWKSKTFVTNEVPVLSWARIEGAYPLTFRLYADGAVVQVKTVANDEPFRLKSGRWREWAVEIEGTTRVLGIRLAQSVEELWQ